MMPLRAVPAQSSAVVTEVVVPDAVRVPCDFLHDEWNTEMAHTAACL